METKSLNFGENADAQKLVDFAQRNGIEPGEFVVAALVAAAGVTKVMSELPLVDFLWLFQRVAVIAWGSTDELKAAIASAHGIHDNCDTCEDATCARALKNTN